MSTSAKEVADFLRKKYETTNPFHICAEKGIHIMYENLGNIMGYFNEFKRIKIIHLNENLSSEEVNFVCAHELGHAMLHPNLNTPFLKRHTLFSIDKIEREANTFAVELMLSDNLLKEYSDCSMFQISRTLGIPAHLIQLKRVQDKKSS